MTGLLLLIELCLCCMAIAAAFLIPNVLWRWGRSVEYLLRPLLRRPTLTVLTIGLLACATRLAVLPVLPIPEPTIQDEFSYLLAADTFAHGRLANPTHPMWTHFETFHVNQKPTYASMYYPAQGMLLALGQVFFGHPFFAVWLSVGLMCGGICWMLQGWMPGKWAFLGGLLAVTRLGVFSYWADSYYGGTLPALGGALVLGALPRIQRRQRFLDAVLMAVGLAVLANTRPFEGLFFAIPIAIALGFWIWNRNGSNSRISVRRIVLPIAFLLSLTAAGMGYYFWRVTGSPFRIPYQVNIETYGLVYFPWQQLKPLPEYRHAVMRDFYSGIYNVGQYHEMRLHPIENLIIRIIRLWLFFLGPVLTLPFLTWAAVARSRRAGRFISRKTRFLILVGIAALPGLLLPVYVPQPHYAAALTGVIYALLLQSMRHVWLWQWKGNRTGSVIVLALPLICVALLVVRVVIPMSSHGLMPNSPATDFLRTWASPRWTNVDRARALAKLREQPGRQLVIVRYKPKHEIISNEWVYNDADIDNAKIVWARGMLSPQDEELIRYFRNRQVWLAEPDEQPPRLSLYKKAQ
jgi:hypothetical protein